ncbi:L-threonylcarbamoyladenylate synthase [Corynebacterium kalidii]|jgi:tRNA A37 threonylcarbamoyladenosine synthetase subunit TsaC/SUA5/YrdC|uniref:Sua5/YciO/YrdC/YwlC family protein n=1 Tax=Corynebacterium kalidii TaxID=2931982 RepID=A0A9X1WI37_9CORY|nr:Sua5/YciO/YrdC/YwlC family protein [Corynebacterium kalidii]MCJ7859519.1 Sua5/YciO/YrdC/YwlC family protein [Corynebacterium kalidii]
MAENETSRQVQWNGGLQQEAVDLLRTPGHIVVTPTKVGYIIATTDREGLERKFAVKHRKRNKPGVVLCGSMEQLRELAQLTPEIEKFYQTCVDRDILMGCILPWKDGAQEKYMPEGAGELASDTRNTSCFVLKFGTPGENIARELWEKDRRLVFASSANPSGQGNRGLIEGIGEEIAGEADLIIEGNDYVASIQPDKTIDTRYEQGVMVSMVDDDGTLVPEQHGERGVTPCPTLIRKGIYNDEIVLILAEQFNSWDFRQGGYY